jgi:hypothetical protein
MQQIEKGSLEFTLDDYKSRQEKVFGKDKGGKKKILGKKGAKGGNKKTSGGRPNGGFKNKGGKSLKLKQKVHRRK